MIQIALKSEFALTKGTKTPGLLQKLHAAFLQAQPNPNLYVTLSEGPGNKTSSVARVLKRFPEIAHLDQTQPTPGHPTATQRQISNELDSKTPGAPVNQSVLLEIASGIPNRYPFFSAEFRITAPIFGESLTPNPAPFFRPGIVITDYWGHPKRQIKMRALTIVSANPATPTPPTLPNQVAAILEILGPHSRPKQIVLPGQFPEMANQASALTKDLKSRLGDIIKNARLPHDFDETDDQPPRQPPGPRKPALVNAFRPLGYRCQSEGMMVLVCTRRTSSNLTLRLTLDLGTWGHHVHPSFAVYGLGFALLINLPISPSSAQRTLHWLVDAARWHQIVQNLAALVAELERSVIPAFEALGPTPSWYEPEVTGPAAHTQMRARNAEG